MTEQDSFAPSGSEPSPRSDYTLPSLGSALTVEDTFGEDLEDPEALDDASAVDEAFSAAGSTSSLPPEADFELSNMVLLSDLHCRLGMKKKMPDGNTTAAVCGRLADMCTRRNHQEKQKRPGQRKPSMYYEHLGDGDGHLNGPTCSQQQFDALVVARQQEDSILASDLMHAATLDDPFDLLGPMGDGYPTLPDAAAVHEASGPTASDPGGVEEEKEELLVETVSDEPLDVTQVNPLPAGAATVMEPVPTTLVPVRAPSAHMAPEATPTPRATNIHPAPVPSPTSAQGPTAPPALRKPKPPMSRGMAAVRGTQNVRFAGATLQAPPTPATLPIPTPGYVQAPAPGNSGVKPAPVPTRPPSVGHAPHAAPPPPAASHSPLYAMQHPSGHKQVCGTSAELVVAMQQGYQFTTELGNLVEAIGWLNARVVPSRAPPAPIPQPAAVSSPSQQPAAHPPQFQAPRAPTPTVRFMGIVTPDHQRAVVQELTPAQLQGLENEGGSAGPTFSSREAAEEWARCDVRPASKDWRSAMSPHEAPRAPAVPASTPAFHGSQLGVGRHGATAGRPGRTLGLTDPSTGTANTIWGVPIANREEMDELLCPDNMLQRDRDGFMNLALDVTRLPGMSLSDTADGESDAFSEISAAAASIAMDRIGHDVTYRSPKHNALARAQKSYEQLVDIHDSIRECKTSALEAMHSNMAQYLYALHYSNAYIEEYLHGGGLLPRIIEKTVEALCHLYEKARFAAYLPDQGTVAWKGGMGQTYIKYYATLFGHMRSNNSRRVLILKGYTELRDGHARGWFHPKMVPGLFKQIAECQAMMHSSATGKTHKASTDAAPSAPIKCAHCQLTDVHGPAKNRCPFKDIPVGDIRPLVTGLTPSQGKAMVARFRAKMRDQPELAKLDAARLAKDNE